jgi:hypothetical protein
MIKRYVVILMGVFLVAGFGGLFKIDASAQTSDRDALKGFMTQFLDALTSKKTDSLPLDANVKVTENCKTIKVGDGYYKDVNGTVKYRLDIIDVAQSGVGALTVIKGTSQVLFAVRLKIKNQKITEIETMVTKNSTEGGGIFNPDGFKVPPADSDMTVMPKAELLNTRAEMIATASKYPEAMKKGTGTFNKNGLYYSKGAYRIENGNRMAGPGCVMGSGCEDIGTQGLPTLSGMVYKPALIDEQAGIAFLRLNFGKGSLMSGSGTLDVFEAFKIYNKDTMHCVYAIMNNVPEGTGFGWDYNPVGTMKSPLLSGSEKNGEKILATSKGLAVQLELPCDKIMVEIYDIAGKLVRTKTAENVPKSGMMFVPMDMSALPPGHFIGCARFISGGKKGNSLLFSMNTIR